MINLDISREEFKTHVAGKTFKFFPASHRARLGWAEVDQALFSWDPSDNFLKIVKGGENFTHKVVESFQDIGRTRARLVKDLLYAELADGATLLLNRLDLKNQTVNELTFSLGQFYGERAISNGYVSFGEERAFNKHWDTHDVFAVQLAGRKHWKVFEPTFKDPLVHQKSKPFIKDCPPTPVFERTLEAGDILYIPRGWWHEVLPVDGEPTFHIAVGIHASRVRDYLSWLCSTKLDQHPVFRLALNNAVDQVPDEDAVIEQLNALLVDPQNIEEFNREIRNAERTNSPFQLERLALKKDVGTALPPDETLKFNSVYPMYAVGRKTAVNGFNIEFDQRSFDAVQGVIESRKMSGHEDSNLIMKLLQADVLSIRRSM